MYAGVFCNMVSKINYMHPVHGTHNGGDKTATWWTILEIMNPACNLFWSVVVFTIFRVYIQYRMHQMGTNDKSLNLDTAFAILI